MRREVSATSADGSFDGGGGATAQLAPIVARDVSVGEGVAATPVIRGGGGVLQARLASGPYGGSDLPRANPLRMGGGYAVEL